MKVSVDVTNTGKMNGEEVVEIYVTDKEVIRPCSHPGPGRFQTRIAESRRNKESGDSTESGTVFAD